MKSGDPPTITELRLQRGALLRRVRLPRPRSRERRVVPRYPVILEIDYWIPGRGKVGEACVGHTIDVSSAGLRFVAQKALQTGLRIELSIAWPVMLHGGVRMQLVVSGRVVRSENNLTAVKILRHEFRTRGNGVLSPPTTILPPRRVS
jgi:hypothetical protein